jgi:tRNA pseudouridine55 synthase
MQHGLLLIDKDPGMTSHDVVQRVRRIVRQKKVGHCGTLDPDATGLLVLTLGKATRLTRFFIQAPKVYDGTIRFGVATDTYDGAGEVVAEGSTEGLTREQVAGQMAQLEGTYPQVPPPYCAKKIKGVKYYELARRGEEVPLEPKEVTVYSFEPTSELAEDRVAFRASCSTGTYARTLANDLGMRLGVPAHLESLRRLRIGGFAVEQAIGLVELARRVEAGEEVGPAWIGFDDVPLPFHTAVTDAQQERRLTHGQTVLLRELDGEEGDWVKLLNRRQQFIAVGTVIERIGQGGIGVVQPKIVFQE